MWRRGHPHPAAHRSRPWPTSALLSERNRKHPISRWPTSPQPNLAVARVRPLYRVTEVGQARLPNLAVARVRPLYRVTEVGQARLPNLAVARVRPLYRVTE